MEKTHQMEGSLHLIGQVVTPHQTKQKEVYGTNIEKYCIIHQFQKRIALKRINWNE